jgi:maleate isomerase
MPDVTGWRAKVGVIVPSTNTVVEHDLAVMRPPGVTFHAGRMHITSPGLGNDEDFEALLLQIRASIGSAVERVMTCQPDYLLMGMSAETFWGGVEGNAAFIERIRAASGLEVSTGASATRAALEAYGVRRIAVFSPYQPVADREVGRFYTEAGFDVVAITGLRCASATAIAEVTPEEIGRTVRAIDSDDVEAIVQVGTNLSFVAQADALEGYLGKPVLAINACTLWHSLRSMGMDDRIEGATRLLRDVA